MATTKLYNKISLREHPDHSPVADATFVKGHSFIFPGDELVMCTVIDAPTDIGGSWAGRQLQSVKMSLIAKKPNIYSEEYGSQYESTRSFVLDSVIIPLTGSNCPVVPWGSDGYAPNINFTQDRNWQLPSGDFKRQIKAFTTHAPSSSSWKFNFWYPIVFNEQYWLALIAADNDFYNTGEPQNGKNQKWLRYHDPAALPFGWLITYRFELNYKYFDPSVRYMAGFTGDPYTIVSELNLSNEQTGIQDYNSNTDYASKSIKTCQPSGTPSLSCFIFTDKNTECYGYFTKQTAWDALEKDNLTAIFRIRPYESGDILGSRGSSKFPITTDVVWAAVSEPITTDGGINIETDDGFYIATDNDGNAVTISFDPSDDKIITIKGVIDYLKLGTIFPGVIKFSLYCRLYNGTILLGESKTTIGTFNISGNQFVENTGSETYTVDGIPAGFTYNGIELPEGWTLVNRNVISGTQETFDVTIGIGSGTIIVKYTDGTYFKNVYLDVYSGALRMGEEITSIGTLIPSNPLPVNPTPDCGEEDPCPHNELDCSFTLDVFADADNPTDETKNDKSDFYGLKYMGSAGLSAITLTLQKNNSNCGGCDWTDKYTFVEPVVNAGVLLSNPYGFFFAFGHTPNFTNTNYVDDYGNRYTGVLLHWIKVLQAFGAGQYRMKIVYTSAIDGSTATDYDVRIFCLHQWNCHNIDGTVRIETLNTGLRGTMESNQAQIDFGASWYGQVRLRGIFYEVKPNYNKEFNQYGDQEYNAFKPIVHELIPKFSLDIKPAPGWIDWLLSNYILLSDQIFISDYNASNRKKFIRTPVINESGIETSDEVFTNPLALSKISLSYGQNNLRKRNN